MATVAVYLCDMAYGGPEEGGWWYDTGTLTRIVRTIRNQDKAYDYCRRLNKKLQSRVIGPNQGRREYTSVISEGEYQARVFDCDETIPKHFPETRPHYE
jgi:hypothetical protein